MDSYGESSPMNNYSRCSIALYRNNSSAREIGLFPLCDKTLEPIDLALWHQFLKGMNVYRSSKREYVLSKHSDKNKRYQATESHEPYRDTRIDSSSFRQSELGKFVFFAFFYIL